MRRILLALLLTAAATTASAQLSTSDDGRHAGLCNSSDPGVYYTYQAVCRTAPSGDGYCDCVSDGRSCSFYTLVKVVGNTSTESTVCETCLSDGDYPGGAGQTGTGQCTKMDGFCPIECIDCSAGVKY